jgi:hypothetical protein
MRRTFLTMTVAAVMAAGSLMAGGFWLQLGNPEASTEAQKANAVVTIIAAGCSDPAKAEITATAIGTVDGKRKSIPLSVTKLSKPGMFAIAQQWPKEGKWVIQLEGKSDGRVTSTLVTASPQGVDRLHAKSEMRTFAPKEVESLLQ